MRALWGGQPPYFDDCSAPESELVERMGSACRGNGSGQYGTPATGDNGEVKVVQDVHAGKARGMSRALWKRGLDVAGISTPEVVAPQMR